MNVSAEYEVLTITLSVVALVLSLIYAWRTVRSYQQFHDDRAAINLSKGIGLVVISFGMFISSIGLVWFDHSEYAVAGLMLSRGALIALLATLLLVAIRPGAEGD